MSQSEEARRAAELAARQSYGRLLAYLAARTLDVAAAEDALADAFHAALRTWPERGVPDVPDAWLLTAARRSLVSQHRREQVRVQAEPVVAHLQALADVDSGERFPDERLGLLFICAHPAIDPTVRAPLMLQVVLGLDAARLASAFLVAPATMSQRLVRAKTKIAAAGIPFGAPEPRELPGRVADVLDAIYAAFGIAWSEVVHGTERWVDLAEEALWLARVVVDLLPDSLRHEACWRCCCTVMPDVPPAAMPRVASSRSASRTSRAGTAPQWTRPIGTSRPPLRSGSPVRSRSKPPSRPRTASAGTAEWSHGS